MKTLTIVYISNRDKPEFNWFYESFRPQRTDLDLETCSVKLIYIKRDASNVGFSKSPKPTVWSGPSRLTKEDWWSAASARNSGICHCQTEWIAFVDDRCVLLPGWLDCVKEAMEGNYIVCGSYEKRHSMTVENGIIKNAGIITGTDSRLEYCEKYWVPHGMKPPFTCPGEWTYGCAIAMPLEWILNIGGFEEMCDSSGGEDYIMGLMAQNNGYPIKFDSRMRMVEDRTPSEIGPVAIRRDKGVSPNDKSHALLEMLRHKKTTMHGFDIRAERDRVLAGQPWSPAWGPTTDFFDGQPVSEMT